jgi:hypothetical protein
MVGQHKTAQLHLCTNSLNKSYLSIVGKLLIHVEKMHGVLHMDMAILI